MVLKRAARSALLCKAPFTEAPAVLDAAIDLLMNARSPSTFRGWDLALRRYNYYCSSLRIADKDRWPPTSHVALGFIAFPLPLGLLAARNSGLLRQPQIELPDEPRSRLWRSWVLPPESMDWQRTC